MTETAIETIATEEPPFSHLTLSQLFKAHRDSKNAVDALADHKRATETTLNNIRVAIESRLRAEGLTSTTDAATGINARIEQKRTWRCPAETQHLVCQWLKDTGRWDDYTFTDVDYDAVVLLAKSGETIPGIELVPSERLVITPAKGVK